MLRRRRGSGSSEPLPRRSGSCTRCSPCSRQPWAALLCLLRLRLQKALLPQALRAALWPRRSLRQLTQQHLPSAMLLRLWLALLCEQEQLQVHQDLALSSSHLECAGLQHLHQRVHPYAPEGLPAPLRLLPATCDRWLRAPSVGEPARLQLPCVGLAALAQALAAHLHLVSQLWASAARSLQPCRRRMSDFPLLWGRWEQRLLA